MDENGRCQARFPLSIILKVTRGNEVVGLQKHILYIISYKLPWVLRQKILVTIWNSPSLFFIGASSLSGVWKSGKRESGIGTRIGTGTGTGTGIGTRMARKTYIKAGTTFTLI